MNSVSTVTNSSLAEPFAGGGEVAGGGDQGGGRELRPGLARHDPLLQRRWPPRAQVRQTGLTGEGVGGLFAAPRDPESFPACTPIAPILAASCAPPMPGTAARLSGWVHSKRDHGGLLFIDLRDNFGLTQIVFAAGSPVMAEAEALRPESVVTVTGQVVMREGATVNPKLPTGEIELRAETLAVQSAAEVLPIQVAGEAQFPEELRLRYRFIDLRRERLHRNLHLRAAVIASIRRRMIAQGFTEFQTPILTASSPEGARDFLVPARLHPGKFYALPQAPQQFKQLCMVAGFDRYFQIAPCFRDEASRADRSPGEFYQLDLEMSFVTQEDVFAALEPVMAGVFEEFAEARAVTQAALPAHPV